jgi:hypothetical protein
MLNAFDGCMRSMRLSTTRRIAAFDLRKRSLGLSMRMRALLSFGEADRDRRASLQLLRERRAAARSLSR